MVAGNGSTSTAASGLSSHAEEGVEPLLSYSSSDQKEEVSSHGRERARKPASWVPKGKLVAKNRKTTQNVSPNGSPVASSSDARQMPKGKGAGNDRNARRRVKTPDSASEASSSSAISPLVGERLDKKQTKRTKKDSRKRALREDSLDYEAREHADISTVGSNVGDSSNDQAATELERFMSDQTRYPGRPEDDPSSGNPEPYVTTERIVTKNVMAVKPLLRYLNLRQAHFAGLVAMVAAPAAKVTAVGTALHFLSRRVLLPPTNVLHSVLGFLSTRTPFMWGPLSLLPTFVSLARWTAPILTAAYSAWTIRNTARELMSNDFAFVENIYSVRVQWHDREEYEDKEQLVHLREKFSDGEGDWNEAMVEGEFRHRDLRSYSAQAGELRRKGGVRGVMVTIHSANGPKTQFLTVIEELVHELLSADKAKFNLKWSDFEVYLKTKISVLSGAINIPRNQHGNVVAHTLFLCSAIWRSRKLALQALEVVTAVNAGTGVDF